MKLQSELELAKVHNASNFNCEQDIAVIMLMSIAR